MNESIYYNVNTIHNTIQQNQSDANYYLIAHHQRYENICHFRVDCMSGIKISKNIISQTNKLRDFNIAEYSKSVFGMFSGNCEKVEIEFDNSLINVVIDR